MLHAASLVSCLALSFLAACSGSGSAGGGAAGAGGSGGAPEAFAKYCAGTLKTEHKLMTAMGPGGWMGDGSHHAPAGTTFYVAVSFGAWDGYVIQADGTPMQISAPDFMAGLVKDTDFTSDCATDDKKTSSGGSVLLATATFFADAELTGKPCTLDAGTELTSLSFSGGGAVAWVSSAEITAECGFEPAYSEDILYASLIVR